MRFAPLLTAQIAAVGRRLAALLARPRRGVRRGPRSLRRRGAGGAAVMDALLSGFRWYRRWRGGHWERWWIDAPVCADVWVRTEHGRRPPLAMGTPRCEDYTPPSLAASPYREAPR